MLPKVSMLVITYNHEKYIAQCIHSIITQSLVDFELIIVDDGSTDNTRKIIEQFVDSRIHYHYQENSGPSSATNTGISLAHSEYISLISGDDIAYEGRLERQYHYFQQHPKTTILFGQCDIIDDDGHAQPSHPLLKIFINRSAYTNRYQLFNRLFFHENCLNAATCMFRRSFFQKIPSFQFTSIQLQDYMMWLEWLKHSEFVLLDEKFTYYRVRNNNKNLSSEENNNRMLFEHATILENILNNLNSDFFKKAFALEAKSLDFSDSISFELEKALLYLKHSEVEIQSIGLKKLFYLLQDQNARSTALSRYNLNLKDYFNLTEKSYGTFQLAYNNLFHQVSRFLPIIKKYHQLKLSIKKLFK